MLKKILSLSTKYGYLSEINNLHPEVFKIGPTGNLLKENLRQEWFYSMVINRDCSIFLNDNSFKNTFHFAKEICTEKLPFGIAEVVEEQLNIYKDQISIKNNDFRSLIPYNREILICTMFIPPSNSIQIFHQLQKQRKMWWRKFSANPGRYSLSDIQIDKQSKNQSVEIHAKYEWCDLPIEQINLFTSEHPYLSLRDLQAKDGRKIISAHYIISQISLPTMIINTLCDAYDERTFHNENKPLLRLHRKLAPYKISFAIPSTGGSEELNDLALYLCKELRLHNISCLLLPTSLRNTLEYQWNQYDQLGVPYGILLNENTLKNGIALLRSRETTLKEQVHVAELVKYVELIFKNY